MSIGFKTNILAQTIRNNIRKSTDEVASEMDKLSSGKRISSAADDPAGLGVGTKLDAQVKGLKQASRNAGDGLSMIQTAEGALEEISSMLIRLRELSIQSASDTVGGDERELIDIEYQELKEEIDRISGSTTFNGSSLLEGNTGKGVMDFQVGTYSGEENVVQYDSDMIDSRTSSLGIDGTGITEKDDALSSLEDIDEAITNVSKQRAALGSIQSRLRSTENSIETQVINQEAAKSHILDVDVAESTSKLASAKITQQAGISTLSQANNMPYGLKKLLG